MRLSFSLFTAALLAGAHASNVVTLVPNNFDKIIGKGTPALVEFFAPWCGHCKDLAPVYEQLADAFSHAKDKVIIAKVDADGEGKSLASKYDVHGFPTLKWFKADGKYEPYESDRDLNSLAEFVSKNSGVKPDIKPTPPPQTLVLDSFNFDEVVMDKSKNVLVSFTAPWCGHCKSLKPIYEQVAVDLKPESDCVVANIDASAEHNQKIASKYEITSFPTIKFFSKENKEPEVYEGDRSEEALLAYLNEKCGTHRTVGGSLGDEAGRLADFDALASKFILATGEVRNSILKEASLLASKAGETSRYYLRVMQKIVSGTEAYLEKEAKRLTTILEKRSLSQSKLDEIKIKANIIKAFIENEAEGAGKKVEGLYRNTAEL